MTERDKKGILKQKDGGELTPTREGMAKIEATYQELLGLYTQVWHGPFGGEEQYTPESSNEGYPQLIVKCYAPEESCFYIVSSSLINGKEAKKESVAGVKVRQGEGREFEYAGVKIWRQLPVETGEAILEGENYGDVFIEYDPEKRALDLRFRKRKLSPEEEVTLKELRAVGETNLDGEKIRLFECLQRRYHNEDADVTFVHISPEGVELAIDTCGGVSYVEKYMDDRVSRVRYDASGKLIGLIRSIAERSLQIPSKFEIPFAEEERVEAWRKILEEEENANMRVFERNPKLIDVEKILTLVNDLLRENLDKVSGVKWQKA